MSAYAAELADAERQGLEAYDAMEAWLNRPLDAPDVAGAVLEGYAKELRESRARIQALLGEHGLRDDLEAALQRNGGYHSALGLSVKDAPEIVEIEDGEPSD